MLRRRLLARITFARGFLLIGATIGMVLVAGAASASVPSRLTTHGMPFASGSTKQVIVLLRDKAAGLGARSSARSHIVKAEVGPLAQTLRTHGAQHVVAGSALPFVVASVTSAQEKALKQNSNVRGVFPNVTIPAPTAESPAAQLLAAPPAPATSTPTPTAGPGICPSNPAQPEQDPEALSVINANGALAQGIDGAGVKTAYIAGTIDTTLPDFKRNAAYASPSSPAGSDVVTNVNFEGDPAGTPDPTDASVESFGDASSIAAQGNVVYDLSNFVNAAHPLPPGCNITITGTAPGATVTGIDVFSNTHDTTESNFIQAINYAVASGVKVLNESFGANPFPDTALDATRIADDDAVAAGVTVVVSSGDAGFPSTIGSPATDPKMISVGATTTFRAYQQDVLGGINATNPVGTNGTWINNNIASFSSSGFAQSGGNTVNLVAPGDSNWALCSPNVAIYKLCTNENGGASPIQVFGGTSESSPLTAGAAADVIQAYEQSHGGAAPSPALVKQILVSTADDIEAPAEQQGAGLLNIGAAVKEAESVNGGSGTQGGLLIGPNQINITQRPHHLTHQPLSITNTGSSPVTVNLSTRALDNHVGNSHGTICLNPTASNISCGPPTANTFVIWSGATEVYQEQQFTVPDTHGAPSRLDFTSDYRFSGQSSLLHVALYDPSGAYAQYSDAQGLSDFSEMQVTDPKPGTWTAVFFTLKNGSAGAGTKGPVDWSADTWTYGTGGSIKPGKLTIAPGATQTAMFTAKSPNQPGDAGQSIVLNSSNGSTTTVPVTVRTLIDVKHGHDGGTFSGVLTGGNGRGADEATNTYAFDVPKGQKDIDVGLQFPNVNQTVVAYLTDPEGNTVASSSNFTVDSTQQNFISTGTVNLYKDNPQAGRWTVALQWLPPYAAEFGTAGGAELSTPFTGQVQFDKVQAGSNLPHGGMKLQQGHTYTFDVSVTNTGQSPQAFFLDPRLPSMTTMQLLDQNGSDQNMTLPLDPGTTFPFYIVPTDTSSLQTSITADGPVTYDLGSFTGDPDLEAVTGTNSASLNLSSGDEIQPGLWLLNPSEIGPYGPAGAPTEHASATFDAVTQAFDPTVDPSTGDLWTAVNGLTSKFDPVYLNPGQSTTIPLTITPTASPGTRVSGSVNLDDTFEVNLATFFTSAGGDELASLPFSYTVK